MTRTPSSIGNRTHHVNIKRQTPKDFFNGLLVTAQRLLRRLCDRCKERIELPAAVVRRLQIPPSQLATAEFYKPKGCAACGGAGYAGRLPIFEFLLVDDEIKEKVALNATEGQIRAVARARGYDGLVDSAVRRLCSGLTTLDEVVRAAFVRDEDVDGSGDGSLQEDTVPEKPCEPTT